jgi:chromosome segregation ATPase/predicted flap endonuclease-1-like 5' DNA nuclease
MRPLLLIILVVVLFILLWAVSQGSYTNPTVYILSIISTGLCGYLIADSVFNNAKKKWHVQRDSHAQEVMHLNNEVDILKTEIKSMPPHSEIEALHVNLALSQAAGDKLQTEIAGQAGIITQKNNDIASMRDAYNQLRIQHETVQNNLAGAEASKYKLAEELTVKDAVIAKHTDTITQLQPVIAALNDEHEKLQNTLAEKNAVIAKHQDTLTQLQPVIAAMHDEHEKLQNTLEDRNAVIAKHTNTLTQLQPLIAAMHDEHEKLQNTLEDKNAALAKHTDTITQLQPVIDAMHDEHQKLQNTLLSQDAVQQRLYGELGDANTTLGEYRTAIKELHGIIADKEKEETQFKTEITARDTEISNLKTGLSGAEAERDTVKNELALKNAAMVQHQNSVIALNDVFGEMKQVHDDSETKHQTEIGQVRQVLEETRNKMVSLVGENEKLRAIPIAAVSQKPDETVRDENKITRYLSEDKSIGLVRSHRTRAIDDDGLNTTAADARTTAPPEVPATQTETIHANVVLPPVMIEKPIEPNTVAHVEIAEIAFVVAPPKPVAHTEIPETPKIKPVEAPSIEKVFTVNESVSILPSDDLKIIEGIGPKIELVLNAAGISTWHQLWHTDVNKLHEILSEDGRRFDANDPSTWPEQARLLANGETEKFKAYTDYLISGRAPK